MPFEDLNEENFTIFAIKCYDKPNCIMSEFNQDLRHIKYLKRQLKKYRLKGELNERLILNHIILLGNVFGVPNAVRMLFFKVEEIDHAMLKTFLLFLGQMPERVHGINGKNINGTAIPVDMVIANRLRAIPRGAT